MITKYDIFISNFKEIESLITKLPNTPIDANFKWLEDNTLSSEKKNKMYICRILRNYIQHQKDFNTFLEISDNMLKFLEELKKELISQIEKAEDNMIKLDKMEKCFNTSKTKDILKIMSKKKLEYIPFLKDDILIGTISIYDLLNFSLDINEKENKTLSSFSKFKKNNYKFVKPDILMEEILKIKEKNNVNFIFVTERGTSKTKIIGVIYI